PYLLLSNAGAALLTHSLYQHAFLAKAQLSAIAFTIVGLFLQALANERSTVREELTEQTVYLHALIENSPLAIVVHGKDGRVTLCNPLFQRMFGFSREEALGHRIDELVRSADVAGEEATLTQRILNGEPVHMTASRYRKDGQTLRVE